MREEQTPHVCDAFRRCSLLFIGCNGTLVDPTHLAMWKTLMDSGSVVKHYLLVRTGEVWCRNSHASLVVLTLG